MLALVLALAVAALPAPGAAQERAETIRGRVTREQGRAVPGAEVVVTRAPDRASRSARTDSAGQYAVTFPNGTGDYLVHVSAPFSGTVRRRITRTGSDSVLVADVQLVAEAVSLAPLEVRARREKPSRSSDPEPGTGAAERLADGVPAALAPGQETDPAALAAAMPGMAAAPGGFSALGLAPEQNSTTLNGLSFAGGALHRGAAVRTRVSTSTYDPARGGFAGAQVALELAPGSIFTLRRAHAMVDAPALQAADPFSAGQGGRFGRVQLSAGGEGELVEDTYFYNAAVQASRRTSDVFSLATAGSDVFRAAGVAPDSAARLLGVLAALGAPTAASAAPASRVSEDLTFLGRIDRTPNGARTWGLTAYGRLDRSGALGLVPTAAPGYGGQSTSAVGSVQAVHSVYFRTHYLNETKTAFTLTRDSREPYLDIPAGRVLVGSSFADGTGGLASLAFGGHPGIARERREWTWETTNETQWYSWGNGHRVKLFVQSRLDGFTRTNGAEQLGSFSFHSLADLAANRPSSFVRELGSPGIEGGQWSGAFAAGDTWRAAPNLQVLYGARLEANRFLRTPAFNPAVHSAFGARTDHAPNSVAVSPRLGFTWAYAGAQNNGVSAGALGVRYHPPQGVLRGGVGLFRGYLPSTLLSGAAAATGLPGASRRLVCIGPAAPAPDWAAYGAGAANVPERCADGSGAAPFSDSAAQVELFGRDYAPARSWRGNLAWSGRAWKSSLSVEGILSLNLDQPGVFDLNFAGVPRLTLADEGGRPVYVPASSIVPSTGAAAPADARRSAGFGRVLEHRSDRRSLGRQLVVTLTPDLPFERYALGASYALSGSSGRHRGFDGGAFGDPSSVERAPSDLDVRHQVTAYAGARARWASLTLWGRIASGLPFTPLVDGDVNGDGVQGDRAFVFDPDAPRVDAAVAAGMRGLLAASPDWARNCLAAHQGNPAARNGCRGPWMAALNARLLFANPVPGTSGRLRDRASVALHADNLAGGLDRLLHGSGGLRGWGGAGTPDPVLYQVRGFDPAAGRYLYQVNPRFGDVRLPGAAGGSPFRLTLDVRVGLGRPVAVQQLDRSLRAGRGGRPGPRLTAEALQRRYARNVPDLYARILQESDSLLLSPEQTAALQAAQAEYRAKVDPVWAELAAYLASLPDRYELGEALARQEESTDRVWEISRQEGPRVRTILSPLQVSMLPGIVRTLVEAREKVQMRVYRP